MVKFINHNHQLKWYEYETNENEDTWPNPEYSSLGYFFRQGLLGNATYLIKPDVIAAKFYSSVWYPTSSANVSSANSYITTDVSPGGSSPAGGNVGTAPGSPYVGAWATPWYGQLAESIIYDNDVLTNWGYYNNSSLSKFNVVTSQKKFFDMREEESGASHPGTTDDTERPVMCMVTMVRNTTVYGVICMVLSNMSGSANIHTMTAGDQSVYGAIWTRTSDSWTFIPSTGSTASTWRWSNSPAAGPSRWTSNNSASGDDGAWGLPISGKWDGNSPGPYGTNNAGYGMGNWNAGDSSHGQVHWGSTATLGQCQMFIF